MKKTLCALLAAALCLSLSLSAMALDLLSPEIEACETPVIQTLPKPGEPVDKTEPLKLWVGDPNLEGILCERCQVGTMHLNQTLYGKWTLFDYSPCHKACNDHVDKGFERLKTTVFFCDNEACLHGIPVRVYETEYVCQ